MIEASPRVFLVGAGPGNPGLLTLRAVECLAQADVVIYDRLVPSSLLDHAPAQAERICVSQLPGAHTERYPQVEVRLIEAARQGKCVVRLKGGDPLLFGRGAEEAAALHEAGIPYEIVPGVTAGLAAAAYAGIPLTHREHASAVALVTGHENPDKPEQQIDWAALARFPGTLVVYMGITRLPRIVQRLLGQGKAPQTPAAVIHWGTTGDQRTLTAALKDLPRAVSEAGLKPPAIVIIGPVASFHSRLAWVEQRPLFGKHVLVTRPRAQAGELVRKLELLGAATHVLPVIEIREPADWTRADVALRRLDQFNWLVFTSSNGVQAFVRRLRHLRLDLRALGRLKLAVIGPATADALRTYHLEPDLMPSEFRSESLAAALKQEGTGKRILLARADRGREVLGEELKAVAEVEQIAVYSQIDLDCHGSPAFQALSEGNIDFITLTSSNIARAFLKGLDGPARDRIKSQETRIVSISPVTSAAILELGVAVAAEATEYTTDGVVNALLKLAAVKPKQN